MADLDPKDHIDRKAEQELFRALVTASSPARALTICDRGGKGKSSLLRRLRYNCQHEMRPAVPAALIELDQLQDPAPFSFVSKVLQVATVRGERVGERVRDKFAKFAVLDTARTEHNFTPFADGSAEAWRPTAVGRASVHRMDGGINTGVLNEVHTERAEFHMAFAGFTAEQEQLARERCVEAFFDDLRTFCATRPLVLLLDGWERCNVSLREWIKDELVGNHLLHPEPALRPDKFCVVIAGRPRDPVTTPYGLRDDEFREFFESEEDLRATVRSIASLSEWDVEHVRDFMLLNGYAEPDEEIVLFIKSRLSKGLSLEKILTILSLDSAS